MPNFSPNGGQEAAKITKNCRVAIDIPYLNTVFLCVVTHKGSLDVRSNRVNPGVVAFKDYGTKPVGDLIVMTSTNPSPNLAAARFTPAPLKSPLLMHGAMTTSLPSTPLPRVIGKTCVPYQLIFTISV